MKAVFVFGQCGKSAPVRVTRRLGALVAVCAALAGLSCSSSAGGPDYSEISIRATDASGNQSSSECVTLPVLSGSVVARNITVAEGIQVEVRADRFQANVAIHSAAGVDERSYTQDQIHTGFVESFDTVNAQGSEFEVAVVAPCP